MAAERCPLCQSKLKNGECLSCGYRPPDEGDISALYNYDPTDYPQPQQGVREIIPDVQMEEIYPNRPEMPDIKVHDEQNNTIGRYGNNVGYNNAQGRHNDPGGYGGTQNNNPNPYAENGNFTPYQSPQNNNNPNPYANNGNFRPYQSPPTPKNIPTNLPPIVGANLPSPASSDDINSYSDFFKKYWWALLLSFLFSPFGGIICFSIFKNKVDIKYRWVFLGIMFLRIFFL